MFFQKLRLIQVAAIRQLAMAMAWFLSLFRWRSNYVQQRWTGHDGGDLSGRVCIFVHYDRRGEVHDFVLHYLDALKADGFKILFVSNAPILPGIQVEKLRARVSLILRRANVGYDFGAYKDGVGALPDLEKIDLLLVANDSVYGPFWPISDILARMDMTRANFWGITDSYDFAYHIQSYFLAFSAQAVRDPAFAKFWRAVRYVDSKHYIIRKYEVRLTHAMMRAGLRGAALCGARDAARAVIDAVRAGALDDKALDEASRRHLETMFRLTQGGLPLNMSHSLWDYLIVKMACPFIKRELLQRNPISVPYVSRWPEVIASVSDYDTDLIARHLERSLKRRFV